jgi:hypothetical protein
VGNDNYNYNYNYFDYNNSRSLRDDKQNDMQLQRQISAGNAGPSTASFAKCANDFAQDDRAWVGNDNYNYNHKYDSRSLGMTKKGHANCNGRSLRVWRGGEEIFSTPIAV